MYTIGKCFPPRCQGGSDNTTMHVNEEAADRDSLYSEYVGERTQNVPTLYCSIDLRLHVQCSTAGIWHKYPSRTSLHTALISIISSISRRGSACSTSHCPSPSCQPSTRQGRSSEAAEPCSYCRSPSRRSSAFPRTLLSSRDPLDVCQRPGRPSTISRTYCFPSTWAYRRSVPWTLSP
jgi:hypothetical protein